MSKMHHITLYNKPGCHLCEVAKAALHALDEQFQVELEEINILNEPGSFERYKYSIPVMVIDGKTVIETHIDERKLRRALAEGYGPVYKPVKRP